MAEQALENSRIIIMPRGYANSNQPLSPLELKRMELIIDLLEKDHDIDYILEQVYFIIPKSRERFQDEFWYKSFEEGKPTQQQRNAFRRIYYGRYVMTLRNSLEK
jgi:hypothetical protein